MAGFGVGDALAVASQVARVLSFVPGRSNDDWEPVLKRSSGYCFLCVVDINLHEPSSTAADTDAEREHEHDAEEQTAHAAQTRNHGFVIKSEELAPYLDSLPPQPEGTVRVYIEESVRERAQGSPYRKHVADTVSEDFEIQYMRMLTKGYSALAAQWTQWDASSTLGVPSPSQAGRPYPWCGFRSYDLIWDSIGATKLNFKGMSALRQVALGLEGATPIDLVSHLLKLSKSLCLTQSKDGKPIAFICCQSEKLREPKSALRRFPYGRPERGFLQEMNPELNLDQPAGPRLTDEETASRSSETSTITEASISHVVASSLLSLRTFTLDLQHSVDSAFERITQDAAGTSLPMLRSQLLQLHCCGSIFSAYAASIGTIDTLYVQPRERDLDPRSSALRATLLPEIMYDAYFYEQFDTVASALSRSIHGLLDVIAATIAIPLLHATSRRNGNGFPLTNAHLRNQTADTLALISRFTAGLDAHLKLLDLSRTVQEANGVRILGLLAAIFLPLSLATGFLSMQTRFHDLHYLIYDFVGLVILLATIILVLLSALKLYSTLAENTAQWRPRSWRAKLLRVAKRYFGVAFVSFWALALASFLLGMVHDVSLGLRVLGLGTAALVGLAVLCVPCFFNCFTLNPFGTGGVLG